MKVAIKEMIKYKLRYFILGAIIFLISLLTFVILALSNGLGYDNASLIKDMPDGTFYMQTDAEDEYSFSEIDEDAQETIKGQHEDAMFFSLQLAEIEDSTDQRYGVVYVTASNDNVFPIPNEGEVIIDESIYENGFKEDSDVFFSMLDDTLPVADTVTNTKFNHSGVVFLNPEDFQKIMQNDSYQLAFTEDEAASIDEFTSYDGKGFLSSLQSYSAQQLTLNMITWFLFVISALLFAIFFYMINVQKLSTFGILKAMGVKTIALFKIMWIQMIIITIVSLLLAVLTTLLMPIFLPDELPFEISINTLLVTSGVFLVIGFIGATVSGIQISKVEPMSAINQGGV